MSKKTKKKALNLTNLSQKKIEVNKASIVVTNLGDYNMLSHRLLGNNATDCMYGTGPLAYKGKENKNKTVFVGANPSSSNRWIFVFLGPAGITLLESLMQDSILADCIGRAEHASQIQAEGNILIENNLKKKLIEESTVQGSPIEKVTENLKQLGNDLTNNKNFRLKASFVNKTKTLVLGSLSSSQLQINVQELQTGDLVLAWRARFHSTTASNILIGTFNSNLRKFDSAVSMAILKLLALVNVNPIMNALSEVCQNYYNQTVLLTKRQRQQISLNSKVKYAGSALTSVLTNIKSMTTEEANQYKTILGPFVDELILLAQTNSSALYALFRMKQAIDNAPLDLFNEANLEKLKNFDVPVSTKQGEK